MRLRWLLALVATVSLALPAFGESQALTELGSAERRSARPILERLPPGIRRAEDGPALSPVDDAPGGDASRFVETIENPFAASAAMERLEVVYTVDPSLDDRVRRVLERNRAALAVVILMNPSNGEIYSYVSTDPERFPATRTYPTASLMKVVTAAATLREAPDAAEEGCRYIGSPYQLGRTHLDPPKRGGRLDSFYRAMAISNNQCFARLAVHHVGEKGMIAEMNRVGLLEPPAAGHPAGTVEPIGDALDLGHLGSGLAGSFVTPLGAARLAAVLADGRLVRPFWIAEVRDGDGKLVAMPGRQRPRSVWSPEVAAELRELMIGVTERGTARSAFLGRQGQPLLGPIQVSGKTGSLNGANPPGLYSWFIGVAPAHAPRLAIATVVVGQPPRRSSASRLSASILHSVFCADGACDLSGVERLQARASARDARARAEIEAAAAKRAAEEAARRAAAEARRRELARLHEVEELDYVPRPIGFEGFDFPRHLMSRRVRGKIVLSVSLDTEGGVTGVEVASSSVAHLNDFVVGEVEGWKFTPPRREGRAVNARAELPLQIKIK